MSTPYDPSTDPAMALMRNGGSLSYNKHTHKWHIVSSFYQSHYMVDPKHAEQMLETHKLVCIWRGELLNTYKYVRSANEQ